MISVVYFRIWTVGTWYKDFHPEHGNKSLVPVTCESLPFTLGTPHTQQQCNLGN